MPRGDGTGPYGGGGTGFGRGRNKGNRSGSGPSGICICPSCGEQITHKQGIPCFNETCLKCGVKMTRG
jgi:uncharacterized protein